MVEVKNPDGTYQEAVINKLTDASWYTVGKETELHFSSIKKLQGRKMYDLP